MITFPLFKYKQDETTVLEHICGLVSQNRKHFGKKTLKVLKQDWKDSVLRCRAILLKSRVMQILATAWTLLTNPSIWEVQKYGQWKMGHKQSSS